MITQQQAREFFDYDPLTGVVTRKKAYGPHRRFLPGAAVGTKFKVKNGGCYLICHACGKPVLIHRLIWVWMMGEMPTEIDHKNGDGCDNRWQNLRPAMHAQNSFNRTRPHAKNTSGYRGVAKAGKRWRAFIRVNRVQKFLGYFDTSAEASAAFNVAAREVYGEFAP